MGWEGAGGGGSGGTAPVGNARPALGKAKLGCGGVGVLGPFVWVIQCDTRETKADSWTQQVAGAALRLAQGQSSWGPRLTALCCSQPSWACQNQPGLILASHPERCVSKHTNIRRKEQCVCVCVCAHIRTTKT